MSALLYDPCCLIVLVGLGVYVIGRVHHHASKMAASTAQQVLSAPAHSQQRSAGAPL